MKSTLCHSISKKLFVPFGDVCMTKMKRYLPSGVGKEHFVTKLSFKCVWYISIGHSVSIKASVWLRHSIHSSISHFHKGKLVWGEISCFYYACMFHIFFCKYWLSCLSFDFSYIYIMWFLWGLAWPCVMLPYVILIKTVF